MTSRAKGAGRGRAVRGRKRQKGIVDIYVKKDDGGIEFDALVPTATASKMLAAMCADDVEGEFARLGISLPRGNALVNSPPPKAYVHQTTERGMVAIDAQVPAPAALLVLMRAQMAGVMVRQND